MIKPLRKRHLQIWLVLAILLPAGIVVAWLSIPIPARNKLLQPSSSKALPVILKTYQPGNGIGINIRTTADTTELQLEWLNNQTLTYPTATIYETQVNDSNIQHGKLVGRIEARGNYHFLVDSTFRSPYSANYQLVLYDFIHQQKIDIIKF